MSSFGPKNRGLRMTGDRIVAGDEAEFVSGACSSKSGGPSKLPSRLRASRVNKPWHSKLRTEKKQAKAYTEDTGDAEFTEKRKAKALPQR